MNKISSQQQDAVNQLEKKKNKQASKQQKNAADDLQSLSQQLSYTLPASTQTASLQPPSRENLIPLSQML